MAKTVTLVLLLSAVACTFGVTPWDDDAKYLAGGSKSDGSCVDNARKSFELCVSQGKHSSLQLRMNSAKTCQQNFDFELKLCAGSGRMLEDRNLQLSSEQCLEEAASKETKCIAIANSFSDLLTKMMKKAECQKQAVKERKSCDSINRVKSAERRLSMRKLWMEVQNWSEPNPFSGRALSQRDLMTDKEKRFIILDICKSAANAKYKGCTSQSAIISNKIEAAKITKRCKEELTAALALCQEESLKRSDAEVQKHPVSMCIDQVELANESCNLAYNLTAADLPDSSEVCRLSRRKYIQLCKEGKKYEEVSNDFLKPNFQEGTPCEQKARAAQLICIAEGDLKDTEVERSEAFTACADAVNNQLLACNPERRLLGNYHCRDNANKVYLMCQKLTVALPTGSEELNAAKESAIEKCLTAFHESIDECNRLSRYNSAR